MQEHNALWMVKSSVIQMVWLASSILLAIFTLAHIIREQANFDSEDIEKLKMELEEKKMALAEQSLEIE